MEKPPAATAFKSIKSLPVSYRYDGVQSPEADFQGVGVARNGLMVVSGASGIGDMEGAEGLPSGSLRGGDDSPYNKVEPIDEEGVSTEEEDLGIDGYTPDPLLPTSTDSKWEDTSAYASKKVTTCPFSFMNRFHPIFSEK